MKNKKITISFIVISIILLLAIVGFTFALYNGEDILSNMFTSAVYQTKTTESFVSPEDWKPGDTTPKTLTVQNTGNIPVKVRIKMIESWENENGDALPLEQNSERVSLINLDNTSDWVKQGQYYYYNESLDPNEETSSFIESVTFNPNVTNDYTCTQTGNTMSCDSTNDSYDGGKYTLTFIIETIDSSFADTEWDPDEGTLYGVLKNEYKSGSGFARLYTGSHQDSMDASKSIKDIYHWYGETAANGTAILDKNNVIFAGQCWQMIRTTDTGGVRIIYNGEPTITEVGGENHYDCGTSRPNHIGGIKSAQSLSGSFYYSSEYTTSVSGNTTTYILTNPIQVTVNSGNALTSIANIITNYPYTCKKTSSTETCTTLYKIDSYDKGEYAYAYTTTYRDAIGSSTYNNYYSLSYVGYMYNLTYVSSTANISSNYPQLYLTSLNSTTLNTYENYYFSDSYSMSGNNHVLTNPVKGNTIANYPSAWVGKYMCDSSTLSSCEKAYYVAAIDTVTRPTNPYLYRATLDSGKTETDSSYKHLFGDSIVDNGDGTFEIKGNVQEVLKKDWGNEYSTKINKYVCMPGYYTYDSVNNKYVCSDFGEQDVGALRYITGTSISSFTGSNIYKYGFDIESHNSSYRLIGNNNEDGTLQYIYNWPNISLTNCFVSSGDIISNCGYQSLSKSHYTCFNLSGICSDYYYIYRTNESQIQSVQITGGKKVSTNLTDPNNLLYLMLFQDDVNGNVNTTNSSIKENIDLWYQNTLLDVYDSYIEDTIYCNNRAISSFGGWNPNGGTTHSSFELRFGEYSVSSDLSCHNETDKFSVSNNSAKLIYKVGLLSIPELNLLHQSNSRISANNYWTVSPYRFNSYDFGYYINANGSISTTNIGNSYSVRPAISLISGLVYSSGTGTMADPYVIETN